MAYEDYLNDGEPIDLTKAVILILSLMVLISLGVWYYVFNQEIVNEFITQLCKNLFQ